MYQVAFQYPFILSRESADLVSLLYLAPGIILAMETSPGEMESRTLPIPFLLDYDVTQLLDGQDVTGVFTA